MQSTIAIWFVHITDVAMNLFEKYIQLIWPLQEITRHKLNALHMLARKLSEILSKLSW